MTTAPALTGLPRKHAALQLTRDYDWRDDAACREHPEPETWFPVGSSPEALQAEEAAKRVCNRCPVRTDCLDWAMDTGQDTGVWGGVSEYDRADLTGRHQQYRTSPDDRPAWQVIVETRLGEFRRLEAEGLSVWEIGQRMRTNGHTINLVRQALAESQDDRVSEGVKAA